MTDPLRKPVPGEPFQPNARQTGMFIDAVTGLQQLQRQVGPTKKAALGPGHVLLRNDTGEDLTAEHPILGLGPPLILPEDRDTVVFEQPSFVGEEPDIDDHVAKFAVLVGPVDDGGMRVGVVSGVCWVKVAIEDEEHDYADIDDGSTERLISGSEGSAHILWKEDEGEGEDDVRWALVRLSNQQKAALIVEMTETVGPGKAGNAKVQKITNDSDTLATGDDITLGDTDPVRNILVVNFRPNWLASGIAYLAHKIGDFWVVENDACFQDFMT